MQYYTDGTWKDTVDELNDQQLAFTNVIVLYTDMAAYAGDSHDVAERQLRRRRYRLLRYGGKVEKIYWQKGTPLEALRLYYLTEDGKCSDIPLEVNIGKSYVTVVDIDEAGSLQTGLLSSFDLAATGTATGGEEVELAE